MDAYDVLMHAYAARWVFASLPSSIVDVGSDTLFCGILSQYVPLTAIDLRQWECPLPGLTVQQGDILNLPYESDSLPCVTCLSVVEHVGLGRYGDALDPMGTYKALRELARVVAYGGSLILAAPIGREAGVMFNAHRILTRDLILFDLARFRVVDEVCLFPEPGPLERVATLGPWGYAMWVAWLRKEA